MVQLCLTVQTILAFGFYVKVTRAIFARRVHHHRSGLSDLIQIRYVSRVEQCCRSVMLHFVVQITEALHLYLLFTRDSLSRRLRSNKPDSSNLILMQPLSMFGYIISQITQHLLMTVLNHMQCQSQDSKKVYPFDRVQKLTGSTPYLPQYRHSNMILKHCIFLCSHCPRLWRGPEIYSFSIFIQFSELENK